MSNTINCISYCYDQMKFLKLKSHFFEKGNFLIVLPKYRILIFSKLFLDAVKMPKTLLTMYHWSFHCKSLNILSFVFAASTLPWLFLFSSASHNANRFAGIPRGSSDSPRVEIGCRGTIFRDHLSAKSRGI